MLLRTSVFQNWFSVWTNITMNPSLVLLPVCLSYKATYHYCNFLCQYIPKIYYEKSYMPERGILADTHLKILKHKLYF